MSINLPINVDMAAANVEYASGPDAVLNSHATKTMNPTDIATPVARCRIDIVMVMGQR